MSDAQRQHELAPKVEINKGARRLVCPICRSDEFQEVWYSARGASATLVEKARGHRVVAVVDYEAQRVYDDDVIHEHIECARCCTPIDVDETESD